MNQLFKDRNRHIKYAQSIVLSESDAEDIVQDCYEKLLSKVDLFTNQVKNSNAYFIRLLRNRCLDFIKQRKSDDEYEIWEIQQANHKTPDRLLENKQAMTRLEKMMQKLPEKQRTIFYLRDIEGYELAEIANITESQNEAVRANLSRARKKMRELYNNQK